jgi:hypothetical protein
LEFADDFSIPGITCTMDWALGHLGMKKCSRFSSDAQIDTTKNQQTQTFSMRAQSRPGSNSLSFIHSLCLAITLQRVRKHLLCALSLGVC